MEDSVRVAGRRYNTHSDYECGRAIRKSPPSRHSEPLTLSFRAKREILDVDIRGRLREGSFTGIETKISPANRNDRVVFLDFFTRDSKDFGWKKGRKALVAGEGWKSDQAPDRWLSTIFRQFKVPSPFAVRE